MTTSMIKLSVVVAILIVTMYIGLRIGLDRHWSAAIFLFGVPAILFGAWYAVARRGKGRTS